jgi:hypothetical protein
MAIVWLVVVDVVAVCGAVRASAGSRRLVMLIFGGWVPPRPWFVARPLSKVERGARLGVAQATHRGVVVREPGMLGPPR